MSSSMAALCDVYAQYMTPDVYHPDMVGFFGQFELPQMVSGGAFRRLVNQVDAVPSIPGIASDTFFLKEKISKRGENNQTVFDVEESISNSAYFAELRKRAAPLPRDGCGTTDADRMAIDDFTVIPWCYCRSLLKHQCNCTFRLQLHYLLATSPSTFGFVCSKSDIVHQSITLFNKFSLGWHVVRNQDSNKTEENDLDHVESLFFKAWRRSQVKGNTRAIQSSRARLSKVLFRYFRQEPPRLFSDILAATDETTNHLARIGRSRASLSEQHMFVMELGQRCQHLSHAAYDGSYENIFFDEVSSSQDSRHRKLQFRT
nr:hypothetical protein CFP56_33601 [Quercus suber]